MRKSQSTVANSCQWRMSVHNPRQTDTIVDLAQWLLPGIAQASLPILFCSLHVFPSASVMLVVRWVQIDMCSKPTSFTFKK